MCVCLCKSANRGVTVPNKTVARLMGWNPSKRKRDEMEEEEEGEVELSLLEALENSQGQSVPALDVRGLKKLVLSFERRLKENLEARMKYAENPEKFAESEVELHDEITKLKTLAGAPELYPELVQLNTIPSILGLLTHDNTDIASDVVALIQDLTDEDVFDDAQDPATVLVQALLENNALELLVQNLARYIMGRFSAR